jgi:putative endonuclease
MRGHAFLFIVRCADGSFHVGATYDPEGALEAMNRGEGSAYLRTRLPVALVYLEEFMNLADAEKRAVRVSRMSRQAKEKLASS